jgi:pilus assembly protein CpaC
MTRPTWLLWGVSVVLLATSSVAYGQRRPPPPPPDDTPIRRQDTQELTLTVGEHRTIPAADVKSYTDSGTPGIADVSVTPDKSAILVTALKPGSTSFLVVHSSGTETNWVVNVVSKSLQTVEKEVSDLLQGYTGVRVRRVGSRFFIDGGVSSEGDLARIKRIAELYPGQVESLVTVGSSGVARLINVRIDIIFVQYKKTSGYQVGINYPAEIGGAGSAGPILQSTWGYDFIAQAATANFNVVNQVFPALDIAAQHAWAKVLKQATIITTNGVEATLGNGGEQNFPIATGLTGTIQKISYGTNLTVLPRFDPDTGELEVKVEADVSDLTAPAANTTIPGRDTAKLNTVVHMKLGQSLVLSGIHTRSHNHSTSGLPLLSEIPVLGIFFGTHGDQRDDRDGAIFVVPSVVEAVGRSGYDMIEDAMQQYSAYDGDLKNVSPYSRIPPGSGGPASPASPAGR